MLISYEIPGLVPRRQGHRLTTMLVIVLDTGHQPFVVPFLVVLLILDRLSRSRRSTCRSHSQNFASSPTVHALTSKPPELWFEIGIGYGRHEHLTSLTERRGQLGVYERDKGQSGGFVGIGESWAGS